MPRSRAQAALSKRRKGDGSERGERRDGRREGPALFSSERVQKEGSGRCAADAGRKVRKRNEKECNKLAVRLFSTCIKTSSGATDDLESIARHFPRPSTGASSLSLLPRGGLRRYSLLPGATDPGIRLFYDPASTRTRTANRAKV